jgi:hypothetical protein
VASAGAATAASTAAVARIVEVLRLMSVSLRTTRGAADCRHCTVRTILKRGKSNCFAATSRFSEKSRFNETSRRGRFARRRHVTPDSLGRPT